MGLPSMAMNDVGVDSGRVASAMGENLPAARLRASRDVLGIDSHHDTLIAEFLSRLFDEDPVADRRRSRADRSVVPQGPAEPLSPAALLCGSP